MLVNLEDPRWWYMEIPRTGSSTMDRVLRTVFPEAHAIYPKHWPVLPEAKYKLGQPDALAFTTVRNPYSRAVSCWQYFTKPDETTFLKWTQERLDAGFVDVQCEARPQSAWLRLHAWDKRLRQERLDDDFYDMVGRIIDWEHAADRPKLPRFNDINGPWANRVRARPHRDKPWPDYYCPQSRENVLKLYAEDFSRLDDLYSRVFPGIL